jgi:hypothetical protein
MHYWPPMGLARSFGAVTTASVNTHVRLGSLPTVAEVGIGDGGRRRGHLRLVK